MLDMMIIKKNFIICENCKIEAIILFASYAKGTEHEDIDITIITHDLKSDRFDEELNLKKLRWEIDLRIEPHIIRIEDYKEVSIPFDQEVIDTEIKVA